MCRPPRNAGYWKEYTSAVTPDRVVFRIKFHAMKPLSLWDYKYLNRLFGPSECSIFSRPTGRTSLICWLVSMSRTIQTVNDHPKNMLHPVFQLSILRRSLLLLTTSDYRIIRNAHRKRVVRGDWSSRTNRSRRYLGKLWDSGSQVHQSRKAKTT